MGFYFTQALGNKPFIVPRYPPLVRNQRFRWLVIYYPYRLYFTVINFARVFSTRSKAVKCRLFKKK